MPTLCLLRGGEYGGTFPANTAAAGESISLASKLRSGDQGRAIVVTLLRLAQSIGVIPLMPLPVKNQPVPVCGTQKIAAMWGH